MATQKIKIQRLTIPAGTPMSSILVRNNIGYVIASPEGRSYAKMIGLDSNSLTGFFKGKNFVIKISPFGTFMNISSGVGINPNGAGKNVPPANLESLKDIFPNIDLNGSYADWWLDTKKPASWDFITHDTLGNELSNPVQATQENIEFFNNQREEIESENVENEEYYRDKIQNSSFYKRCKERKKEAQKIVSEIDPQRKYAPFYSDAGGVEYTIGYSDGPTEKAGGVGYSIDNSDGPTEIAGGVDLDIYDVNYFDYSAVQNQDPILEQVANNSNIEASNTVVTGNVENGKVAADPYDDIQTTEPVRQQEVDNSNTEIVKDDVYHENQMFLLRNAYKTLAVDCFQYSIDSLNKQADSKKRKQIGIVAGVILALKFLV